MISKDFLLGFGAGKTSAGGGGGSSVAVEPLDVTANGEYTAPEGTAYSPVTVNVPTGGGGAEDNDVRFLDYDGTIVHSYSAADFAALTAMPENPSHEGLTAQGWNWTLADAQEYVADYGMLDIGQMYITDDGKTRLYITIPEGTPSNRMTIALEFKTIYGNGIVVNWGDGVTEETHDTGWNKRLPHTYQAPGDYLIATDGTNYEFDANGRIIAGSDSKQSNQQYMSYLTKVETGSGVKFGTTPFSGAHSLESVTLTKDSLGSYASFPSAYSLKHITVPSEYGAPLSSTYCASLKSVAIPKNATFSNAGFATAGYKLRSIAIPPSIASIPSNAFSQCQSLLSVSIPDSVTSIGGSAFSSCSCLTSITIPDSVVSIGTSAFSMCYFMSEYHFKSTTPPTLASTNAFSSIPSDCKIYVPYSEDHSILEAYKAATNWSTYASYMVEEEP